MDSWRSSSRHFHYSFETCLLVCISTGDPNPPYIVKERNSRCLISQWHHASSSSSAYNIMAYFHSVATRAGCAVPNILHGDLLPCHVTVAKDFTTVGGSEFYTNPDKTNALFCPIVCAAQQSCAMITTALIFYTVRGI
jgi:hypothetical protein